MRNTEAIAEKFGVNGEQAQALDYMENTALRASAGSGKTRVLTKRFVRILLEETGADLDDIIAITFTRKAATEMKDRIRRELAGWLKKSQYDDDHRLAGFRLRMSEARIDTIHAFLGKLIRQYFQVLGIDPGFTVLEEVDTKVLLLRFTEASIRSIFEDASQGELLNSFMTGYGADLAGTPLRDAVISVYQGMRSAGDTVRTVKARYAGHMTRTAAADGTLSLEQVGLFLLEQLDHRFREYKDRENVLDFSDLELLACDLLERPDSCRTIRNSFRHLMMDEFQDVNPLQMRIVNLLIHDEQGAIPPGRLFIVGDSKQSIYGFRGADYRVFGEACATIAKQGSARQLLKCYRSTDTIIHTVNHIFKRLMASYEPLHQPRENPGRPVELITWGADDRKNLKSPNRWASFKDLIPDGSPEDTDAVLRAPYRETVETSRMTLQGEVIAGRMAALNAEGFPYRDMAILVPSRTSLAAIENGLYARGIPYCVLGGLGFWSRTEVADILNLYRLIFQPLDRASFYAVLRSPLFAFSDDLLLKCRHIDRNPEDVPLRPEVLLERLHATLDDELSRGFSSERNTGSEKGNSGSEKGNSGSEKGNSGSEKGNSGSEKGNSGSEKGNSGSNKGNYNDKQLSSRAVKIFNRLLPLDGLLDPSELFRKVLETTGYSEILLLLPNGEKKIRNLEKLMQVVDGFSRKHGYTARDLPSYLDVLQESGGMDSEAFLDNEDSEAVKILTIHASKGLEFPVVFLPSMDRAVDTVGSRFKPLLVLHPVHGISAIGVDEDEKTSTTVNQAYQEVFASRLNRELEESRRVFYVAATRAQTMLVMVGEHQVAKEGGLDAQNSFMKQLNWALEGSVLPDSLAMMDAEAFEEAGKKEHSIAAEVMEYPYNPLAPIKPTHFFTPARSALPAHRPSGLVSVSQWMSWRDCPRQYWFSRIIRMPGQADIQVSQETFHETSQEASNETTLDSFQDSSEEITLDSSQNSLEETTLDLSQESAPSLADPDLTVDAARLGTWIHTQLQEIPLDRSGPIPSLGRCDLNKTRIPRWLENQRQHAIHLLEGYNLIINNTDGNPAISERLVHSWNEFEFRIKASDSLELIGVIDRLDIVETPDGFWAVLADYKSNHIKDAQAVRDKAAYYAAQLQVYAWAISRMPIWQGKPVEVLRGELYFLDAGQSVTIPVGHAVQSAAVGSLIQALPDLLGLLKQEGYPMKEGDACTWCPHKKICTMLNDHHK